MDLLMVLEDKFDVSIPLNMVPDIATVGQLAKAIRDSKTGALSYGTIRRFEDWRTAHGHIKACGADPFGVKMDRILSSTEALIEGRRTILCGSNNYLGLTFDAESVAAAKRSLDEYGTGTTGSRIANGSYADHGALERDLADFYGKEHCMVFTTGYQANLGAISTLPAPATTCWSMPTAMPRSTMRAASAMPPSSASSTTTRPTSTSASPGSPRSPATSSSWSRASTRCSATMRRSRSSWRSRRSTAPICCR